MIWGWWSGHQEGPGGGLLLQGHGAGLAGEKCEGATEEMGIEFPPVLCFSAKSVEVGDVIEGAEGCVFVSLIS